MKTSMKGRDLITLQNYTPGEIQEIIDLALELKKELRGGGHARLPLAGKSVALYFEKKSLRTRVSFEVGIHQLGGHPVFLNTANTHAGRGEPLADMAKVLDRYVDGVVFRANSHADVLEMAKNLGKPTINALCDMAHPCQALADLMTMYEIKGRAAKFRVAYVGDGNNVANSLLTVTSKTGIDFALACPENYRPDWELMKKARGYAVESGARILLTEDPREAVAGADFVYTDVWVSMGMEEEEERRRLAFKGFCVTDDLMDSAGPGALFMHDLPAHRGEEVLPEVIDGPRSVVYDQAENRLHAQKAVVALLIGD